MSFKLKAHERLRRVREIRNMSQAEFAEMLGLSPAAYGRLERGETQTDFDQLQRFAEVLNVPISDFLPESIVFNNHPKNGYGNLVAGNCYNYIYASEDQQAKELEQENAHLKEKITLLEDKISLLEEGLLVLRNLLKKSNIQ